MARFAQALVLAVLLALGLGACGGDQSSPRAGRSSDAAVVEDPGPVHVHGLGVNRSDGALFLATHTGLFRASKDEANAVRVTDRYQDTMGFTITGPDRFLGSGHPDGRDDLPPFLGLIRSTDAGQTWKPLSLEGRADFHVLEAAGERVYGFGSDFQTRDEQLLVSDDGGRSWERRRPPGSLVSMAIDPEDPQRVIASGQQELYESTDGARSWKQLDGQPGRLTWPESGAPILVTAGGQVATRREASGGWQVLGQVGAPPAAFDVGSDGVLYAALHDGTIKRSVDGGGSWAVRSTP